MNAPPPRLSGQALQNALRTGIELQRIGRFSEAEYQYQAVLFNDPQNADALNLLSTLAIEAKAPKQAVELGRRAVKLQPRNAFFHNNLGTAYLAEGDFRAAKKHLKKALSLRPRFPEAWCGLGKMHRVMLNGEEAETCYQRALKIDPHQEDALTGFAELLIDNGRPEDARPLLHNLLLRNPDHVGALSTLALTQKYTEDQGDMTRLIHRSNQPGTTAQDRERLLHAAGKIANDLGRYEEAIEQMNEAKTHSSSTFPIDLHNQSFDALISELPEDFLTTRSDFGEPSERPVFIVGMPRSGTTLTEQICASHPDVYGAGELPDMRSLAAKAGFGNADPMGFVRGLEGLTKEQSRDLAREYLRGLKRRDKQAARVVDKMPHNYEVLPFIRLLFPNARIIHCRRAPMDNCVSCYMLHFSNEHSYTNDMNVLGQYYQAYHRLMTHWERLMPDQILTMQYEETVADTEARARALIAHIGLPWDPTCLAFYKTERTVRTPSRSQVRQPIYTGSVDRWKRYGDAVLPLQAALGDLT